MHISPSTSSITYPQGFLDFLMLNPSRGHQVGDHPLQASGMARMNAALRALSAQSPTLTLDQVATAAQRARLLLRAIASEHRAEPCEREALVFGERDACVPQPALAPERAEALAAGRRFFRKRGKRRLQH